MLGLLELFGEVVELFAQGGGCVGRYLVLGLGTGAESAQCLQLVLEATHLALLIGQRRHQALLLLVETFELFFQLFLPPTKVADPISLEDQLALELPHPILLIMLQPTMTEVEPRQLQPNPPHLLLLLTQQPILLFIAILKMFQSQRQSRDLLPHRTYLLRLATLPRLDNIKLPHKFLPGLLLIILGDSIAIEEAVHPLQLHTDYDVPHHQFVLFAGGEGVGGWGLWFNVLMASQAVAAGDGGGLEAGFEAGVGVEH